MSIATKQQECLQTFQYKNNKEQQVSAINKERQPQQWNRKKSIDTTIKSEKHVTKAKQLARQTPVVIIETETELELVKSPQKEEEVSILKDIHDDDTNFIDQEDYQIYQNGNVNEFFKEDNKETPKSIDDICLVNDHYILVKMPEYDVKVLEEPDNATRDIQRKDFIDTREKTAKALRENLQRDNRKFCRYLRSKRNRITRIAPIHEEPEDSLHSDEETLKQQSKLHCLKGYSCWQSKEEEVEVYQSKTTIKKSPQNPISITNKNSSFPIMQDMTNVSEEIQTHKELETISGSLIKSSLQRQVSIHSYGSFISTENNNNKMDITHCHKSYPLPPPPAPLPRRKCPRFESLYWLLRPFRGKYRKPKPKIQAVVYKTYFVKWTKPPDTLAHGYGVKSSNLSDIGVSVLRRCRSAVF